MTSIGYTKRFALRNGTGGLNSKTIGRLCNGLNCQPGDLMEYVPDEETEQYLSWENIPNQISSNTSHGNLGNAKHTDEAC